MRLLSRHHNPRSTTVTALELPEDSRFAVHGESYRQPAIAQTAKIARNEGGEKVFRAILVPEPGNQYDSNAIAVYSDVGQLGYLPRDVAREFGPVFEAIESQGCGAGVCTGVLTGGTQDKPSYGVVLRLSGPQDCLREVEDSSE
jgi:hypothetical protein